MNVDAIDRGRAAMVRRLAPMAGEAAGAQELLHLISRMAVQFRRAR
jgi:hypothetical protein